MIKTNPYTDLTNPSKYNEVMDMGQRYLTREDYQRLNQTCGVVWMMGDFKIILNCGIFKLSDKYGNTLYIAKENAKEKVFDLTRTNDFQFCDSLEEFSVEIRKFFKRK